MLEAVEGTETEECLRSEIARLKRVLIERTEALLVARKELGVLEQMKRDFIALVSHELRTPLTSVIGISDLIQQGLYDSGEDLRQMSANLSIEAKRLGHFVDDVIEFVQWSSGLVSLKIQQFDLVACVKESAHKAASQHAEKGLELVLKTAEELWIEGDASLIADCFLRILDNSCKFSPAGGKVEVCVEWVSCPGFEAEGRAVVLVRDHGAGIQSENLHDLCKVFTLCHSCQNHVRGKGLGLAICWEILKAHAGTIRVESPVEEKGCGVIVTLPLSPRGPQPGDQGDTVISRVSTRV